jgi:hypothetical protein
MSKSFNYKVKSSLRKKIQTFVEIELPLLLKNGLFPVTDDRIYSPYNDTLGEERSYEENSSLGKAKVLGPNPSQGAFF